MPTFFFFFATTTKIVCRSVVKRTFVTKQKADLFGSIYTFLTNLKSCEQKHLILNINVFQI